MIKKQIKVVDYNPRWPEMFANEADKIKEALGQHVVVIHHIGSTSVPGLNAKEDLDILCIVDALPNSLRLQDIGYIYKGEINIPLRYYFSKNTDFSNVNLHVVESEHGFIALNLTFRDYLRAHDEARDAYGDLKNQLLQDPRSMERVDGLFTGYNLGKDQFIKDILDKAGYDAITINFCVHYNEWTNYHRIRREQIFTPQNIDYDPNHPSIRNENHFHFVLSKGSEIVCVAHVEFLGDQEALLHAIATDEPHKNQGFETKMVEILEKWIRRHNRKTIKLRPSNHF